MLVLSIDPGTSVLACSLLEGEKGEPPKIIGTLTLKNILWTQDGAKKAGRLINAQWIRNQDREWKDIIVIIEAPAPRYYGRANNMAMMRLWWQIWYFVQYFKKKVKDIILVDSFEWNKKKHPEKNFYYQYTDNEKLEHFKLLYPEFGKLNGPRKWANKDVRDASLMGYWWFMHDPDEKPWYFHLIKTVTKPKKRKKKRGRPRTRKRKKK